MDGSVCSLRDGLMLILLSPRETVTRLHLLRIGGVNHILRCMELECEIGPFLSFMFSVLSTSSFQAREGMLMIQMEPRLRRSPSQSEKSSESLVRMIFDPRQPSDILVELFDRPCTYYSLYRGHVSTTEPGIRTPK